MAAEHLAWVWVQPPALGALVHRVLVLPVWEPDQVRVGVYVLYVAIVSS